MVFPTFLRQFMREAAQRVAEGRSPEASRDRDRALARARQGRRPEPSEGHAQNIAYNLNRTLSR